jgi:hypothetical protein
MVTEFKEVVRQYSEEPLTRQVMLHLLKGYKRPYDKIHELVKAGELIQVKRGVYVPGPKISVEKPASLLLANHLWGPSYISLETALAHWGLIPERVYEISSVTLKNSKNYKTPVGRFTYVHAALPYYAFGIKRVQLTKKQVVLMASPEKALCDKIIMTSGVFLRSIRQTLDFLTEDLRMEEEQLRTFRIQDIASWVNDAPKSSSLTMLIKTIEQL